MTAWKTSCNSAEDKQDNSHTAPEDARRGYKWRYARGNTNLNQAAIVSLKTAESVQSLSQENNCLRRRVEDLEKQVSSMMDKMNEAKEKSRLLEVEFER